MRGKKIKNKLTFSDGDTTLLKYNTIPNIFCAEYSILIQITGTFFIGIFFFLKHIISYRKTNTIKDRQDNNYCGKFKIQNLKKLTLYMNKEKIDF